MGHNTDEITELTDRMSKFWNHHESTTNLLANKLAKEDKISAYKHLVKHQPERKWVNCNKSS